MAKGSVSGNFAKLFVAPTAIAGGLLFGSFTGSISLAIGVEVFVWWLAYITWSVTAATAYRNRPGVNNINDDATDSREFFLQSYVDGLPWSIWQAIEWLAANWPSQLLAIPTVIAWLTFSSGLGFRWRFYVALICWAAATKATIHFGGERYSKLQKPHREKASAVMLSTTVKNLEDKPVSFTEGSRVGDATIVTNGWIPPAERADTAREIAGRVEGAVQHAWSAADDDSELTVETFGEFEGESQRVANEINEGGMFDGIVVSAATGSSWILLQVEAERQVDTRRRRADELLAVAAGYVFRGEPVQAGDGDTIQVQLYKEFPSVSAEVITNYVRPAIKGEFVPAEDEPEAQGWVVAIKTPCIPTKEAQAKLAEEVRAVIPGAEVAAPPVPLDEGDQILLRFLPDTTSREIEDSKAWDDLTISAGVRKLSDPPIPMKQLERDLEGRICKAVFRKKPAQNLKDIAEIGEWIAAALQSTSHQVEQIPGTEDVLLQIFYNKPAQLLLTHQEDVPDDVERSKLPPEVDREVIDPEFYLSNKGFFVGLTKNRTPIYIDYQNSAYHTGVWGLSGSGKGLLCTSILVHSLVKGYEVTIISPKTGEYTWTKVHGAEVISVTQPNQIQTVLDRIQTENDRRERLNSKYHVRNWTILRKQAERMRREEGYQKGDLLEEMGSSNHNLGDRRTDARNIVIFDQFQSCIEAARLESEKIAKDIDLTTGRCLSAGRSAEINFIVVSQSMPDYDAGGSDSTISGLLGRVWMGRNSHRNCHRAMGLGDLESHPKVEEAFAHTTGNFCVTGHGDGPESAEIVTGRTPYMSTEQASVLVHELTSQAESLP